MGRPGQCCHLFKNLRYSPLVAIFLQSGSKGSSAVDLAGELIERAGSLRRLLSADHRRCIERPGIGPARYAMLQAALELGRRYRRDSLRVRKLSIGTRALNEFLVAQLRDRPYEVFCCLYLDAEHRFIAFVELFRGTLDGASVFPREVVRSALLHRCAAVILVHNHPSGVPEPSQADELITRRLKAALARIDVEVLDHVVVGDTQCVSFVERGLL